MISVAILAFSLLLPSVWNITEAYLDKKYAERSASQRHLSNLVVFHSLVDQLLLLLALVTLVVIGIVFVNLFLLLPGLGVLMIQFINRRQRKAFMRQSVADGTSCGWV